MLILSQEGRSRFARLGLFVHITAGFMNPGIKNKQVLEIYNASSVRLHFRFHFFYEFSRALAFRIRWHYGQEPRSVNLFSLKCPGQPLTRVNSHNKNFKKITNNNCEIILDFIKLNLFIFIVFFVLLVLNIHFLFVAFVEYNWQFLSLILALIPYH